VKFKSIAAILSVALFVSCGPFAISATTTPTFSTGTGTYHAPPTVKISDGTSGVVIY
jgi:hypothetical protein